MKLNKDCVRDILLYLEENCRPYNDTRFGNILHCVTLHEITESEQLSVYDYNTIHYTLEKLFEGRYIQGSFHPSNQPHTFDVAQIEALSLAGHNLLDNIRPETVWEKTKTILKKVGGFSLDTMSQVANDVMTSYIKNFIGH